MCAVTLCRTNAPLPRRRNQSKEKSYNLSSLSLEGKWCVHKSQLDLRPVRLVNPGGQLVNSNEDTEESEDLIEPPILPEVPFYKK